MLLVPLLGLELLAFHCTYTGGKMAGTAQAIQVPTQGLENIHHGGEGAFQGSQRLDFVDLILFVLLVVGRVWHPCVNNSHTSHCDSSVKWQHKNVWPWYFHSLFVLLMKVTKIRDSSVSIVTRLLARRPGFNFWKGKEFFLLDTASRPALEPTQPPIQWVPGALSQGLRRPGHEADHSPPLNAEVKNAWSYTSTLPYVFMARCLVKHRDEFIF
jgi:hypothetical protein